MHIFKKYKSDSNLYALKRIQISEGEEYNLNKCAVIMVFPAVVNSYNSNREYKNREKKQNSIFITV